MRKEGIMISGVIEWSFDCDKASENAREVFDRVMNRDWLREHGISLVDIDAAWEELVKQLLTLGEPCVVTVIRVNEPNWKWDLFFTNLINRGEK
jgi:hypothetical protein